MFHMNLAHVSHGRFSRFYRQKNPIQNTRAPRPDFVQNCVIFHHNIFQDILDIPSKCEESEDITVEEEEQLPIVQSKHQLTFELLCLG